MSIVLDSIDLLSGPHLEVPAAVPAAVQLQSHRAAVPAAVPAAAAVPAPALSASQLARQYQAKVHEYNSKHITFEVKKRKAKKTR